MHTPIYPILEKVASRAIARTQIKTAEYASFRTKKPVSRFFTDHRKRESKLEDLCVKNPTKKEQILWKAATIEHSRFFFVHGLFIRWLELLGRPNGFKSAHQLSSSFIAYSSAGFSKKRQCGTNKHQASSSQPCCQTGTAWAPRFIYFSLGLEWHMSNIFHGRKWETCPYLGTGQAKKVENVS